MSRQIQIRRGTAAEHTNFTGAVGEITMDTTNNTLRVHDGITAGGTVLAKQSEIPVVNIIPTIPDWSAGVDITPPTSSSKYTCPYDGVYIVCFIHSTNSSVSYLVVNGISTANCISQSSANNANRQSASIYLHQGDVIYWTRASATLYSSTYYPLSED